MSAESTQPLAATTSCSNCHRYVALLRTEAANVYVAYDFESDNFTPSDRRHACSESDRNAYGPSGMTEPPESVWEAVLDVATIQACHDAAKDSTGWDVASLVGDVVKATYTATIVAELRGDRKAVQQ